MRQMLTLKTIVGIQEEKKTFSKIRLMWARKLLISISEQINFLILNNTWNFTIIFVYNF